MPSSPQVIVEAVPNFSEGRRVEVVDAIADAIQAPGVHLLDRSSDWDHNRSVLTVAGAPEAVMEGLFRAVRAAALLINLFEHRGAHPRLGAADVVPLAPIQGITLAECAALATALGRRIGEELGLPVYLYEAAATRPERRNLTDVRRGEFERLVQEIHLPGRAPDFGPAQVGPAGAVVVGARPFLIAYNIYLRTTDVGIAKAIAKAIRESSGGLPAVKAIGLLVNGRAQVSINLVDFTRTPLHVVMDAVTELAAQAGTAVERSELIGLIPQDAMLQAAAHYLKLPGFNRLRVVENAVQAAGSE
ncbi:MAG: glutamate formimidoyltransferase [Caldilineaceae bacterium]|nr:glutamate formimidoyltransferase [Caldilineaceae bacterium]